MLLCRILISFRLKNILKNIGVLPKGLLIDLRAPNFAHAITSSRARYAHFRHRERTLWSRGFNNNIHDNDNS